MNSPSAEKILSLLIDLYSKQMGVKVSYSIEKEKGGTKWSITD